MGRNKWQREPSGEAARRAAHSAGHSTKKSRGMMEQMASTAVGRSQPARTIGTPVTVFVAVDAAGKLQSTSVISSPCPAERRTCRRSAVSIGSIPFSRPRRAAVAWNGRCGTASADGRARRVRLRAANIVLAGVSEGRRGGVSVRAAWRAAGGSGSTNSTNRFYLRIERPASDVLF